MRDENKIGLLVMSLALLAGRALPAQTATQASAPGQAQTGATSGQQPANSTQPGRASTPAGTPATGLQAPGTSPTGLFGSSRIGQAGGQIGVLSAASGESLTLDRALALAAANEPVFVSALAAAESARLDHSIARAALLPQVVYHNQYLFTESGHLPLSGSTSANNTQPTQIFIANNAVHEYVSQGQVTETLGFQQYNALARADANAAIANAELEISRRGLTATVVGLFYSFVTGQGRVAIEERALTEAADFVKQTTQREAEREVAHADVLKAQITLQQRQRDLAEARLAAQKAKLDLGVLLFADPRSPYTVTLPAPAPLPDRAVVDAAAAQANPELASATASLRSSSLGISAARAALLPDVVLNYSYGIDSTHFAANNPDGSRNLGYSASATVDVPVFDWFATSNRIRQARILRDAAKVTLSATQRRLIAGLEEFYAELTLAHDQLDSLQNSADASRESLRLSRLRYTGGEATVLEVVDAQNTLTAAELAQQDGSVRYQLALANLQTLTGTL